MPRPTTMIVFAIASLAACRHPVREAHAGADGAHAQTETRCPEQTLTSDFWRDRIGTHTLADRGTILACAHILAADRDAVGQNLFVRHDLGAATTGAELFAVQYVTEGRAGVATAATALFYLPTDATADVPIVAVDHSTSGMGPSCGPTHYHTLVDALAVPFVARGYAVVAPDYPGMGVDSGMTSYLVGHAEAASTLDAVRALRQFHDPRFDASRLGRDLVVMGYSQGGHAALFAHQAFDASVGVKLLGSVAFAPGLGSIREWSSSFRDGSCAWDEGATYALMSLYAHARYLGGPAPETWLTAAAQQIVPARLHEECSFWLVPGLAAAFRTQADVYQPAFLTAAAACSFHEPCPSFEPWSTALLSEEPGDFASDAPALVLQGLADTVVPPATTACTVRRMSAHHTPVEACAYANVTHLNIVPAALPDVFRWVTARRMGETPRVCASPLEIPCAP